MILKETSSTRNAVDSRVIWGLKNKQAIQLSAINSILPQYSPLPFIITLYHQNLTVGDDDQSEGKH